MLWLLTGFAALIIVLSNDEVRFRIAVYCDYSKVPVHVVLIGLLLCILLSPAGMCLRVALPP